MTQNESVECQLHVCDECPGKIPVLQAYRVKPEAVRGKGVPSYVKQTAGMAACKECLSVVARALGARVSLWQIAWKGHKCPGLNGVKCGKPTLFRICGDCRKAEKEAEKVEALAALEARFNRDLNGEPRPGHEAAA